MLCGRAGENWLTPSQAQLCNLLQQVLAVLHIVHGAGADTHRLQAALLLDNQQQQRMNKHPDVSEHSRNMHVRHPANDILKTQQTQIITHDILKTQQTQIITQVYVVRRQPLQPVMIPSDTVVTQSVIQPVVTLSLIQAVVTLSLIQPVVTLSVIQPVVTLSVRLPFVTTRCNTTTCYQKVIQPAVTQSVIQPAVTQSVIQPPVSTPPFENRKSRHTDLFTPFFLIQ